MNLVKPKSFFLHSLAMTIALIANTIVFAQPLTQEKSSAAKQQQKKWWSSEVSDALDKAGDNRAELQNALEQIEVKQRPAMAFLVENMPDRDLKKLDAEFLLENVRLAYQARGQAPWGKTISDEMFFNDVVAYANVNEKREPWRAELYKKCWPIVKDCRTAAEAAQKLNEQLFKLVNVKYSTKRKRPDQAPSESIEQGLASCTGLSILLSDACRSVSIPARLAGTPLWTNKRGNHTWVEIWDGEWHFTGACEPSKQGLNHGWFVGDASRAKKGSRLHAIYASSFKKTDIHFPLVWARRDTSVPAVNVTDRYTALAKPDKNIHRLMIRVVDAGGKTRIAKKVTATNLDNQKQYRGVSKDESADTNDFLTFAVIPQSKFKIEVEGLARPVEIELEKKPQTIVTIKLK